jgi:OOP family OmpA-OmpF porin
MHKIKNSILASGLTIALAGCVGMEKDMAAEMTPAGSAFNQALYGEYLGRSQVEFAEGDYGNSDLFDLKAQWAAGDAFVVPEEPGDHALPEGSIAELTEARQWLVEALADNGRTTVPELAAHTQLMYDCWVEEQEENRQPGDIAACRAAFLAGLAEIQAAIAPPPMVMAEPEPEPEPMEVPVPPSFFIFFDHDSAALDDRAMQVIDWVNNQVGMREPTRVLVTGHADRSGSDAYNLGLSENRSTAVTDALAAAGISSDIIIGSGLGESEPRLETPDGVRERQNRYARITLIK